MFKSSVLTALAATLTLTACGPGCGAPGMDACREIAKSSGGGSPSNPFGGLQDSNPDNSVIRDDVLTDANSGDIIADAGDEIITEGELVDVATAAPENALEDEHSTVIASTPATGTDPATTTVVAGTVAALPGENAGSTTNDNDASTPAEEIVIDLPVVVDDTTVADSDAPAFGSGSS